MPVHLCLSMPEMQKYRPFSASCLLHQFLKAMYSNELTLLSFMIEQQPGQCHINKRLFEGTNLSDNVLCSRVTIDKSHCSCFLFAYFL